MPSWIINKTLKEKKIKNALIVGVAYKKDLDDTRESPAIKFLNILKKKRVSVSYYDPIVKELKSRNFDYKLKSVKLNKKTIANYDCVFITTDHSKINYELIKKNANLIIDTRNVYKFPSKKILKL